MAVGLPTAAPPGTWVPSRDGDVAGAQVGIAYWGSG